MRRATYTILILIVACASFTGCVRRTLSISSEPAGALVYLNDREVGRTPLDVDFTFHGRYDVRLVKEGYEPLLTSGNAKAPLWDNIPLDLAAEVAPVRLKSRIKWHYVLEPRPDDSGALLERATELRTRIGPAPVPVSPEPTADTQPAKN